MKRERERWLVIGAHDPFPGKNGSALRIRQHLETLQKEGAETLYWGIAEKATERKGVRIHALPMWASLSTAQKLRQAPRLLFGLAFGHDPNTSYIYRRRWLLDLESAIVAFRPTHVLISESWMHRYIRSMRGAFGFHWIQIVDLHNVETHLRSANGTFFGLLRHSWMRTAEAFLCSISDETWVCSTVDQQMVRSFFSVTAKVVPNKVDFGYYQDVERTKNLTFGMVGIWSYEPNAQAAQILLSDIWPKIGSLAKPILVGRNPTLIMRDSVTQGAIVTGEVEDVREHLGRMRTVVVPLREGGGTRMKVLEAMAAGVPVVATPKAVEGLDVNHLEHCVICEPDEMVGWIETVWTDKALENKLRDNARELVREKYSW